MQSNTLVSIIIPCFNAEQYVGYAIQSALDQSYVQKQVIVIDDGSTDNSLNVIKSFSDSIRWETGSNAGAGAARNRGLQFADGGVIQFLDADDTIHPEKLTKMVSKLESGRQLMVACDRESRGIGPDAELVIHKLDYAGQDPVEFILLRGSLTMAALFRKKDIIDVGGFREDLPCAQERDLQLRLACAGVAIEYVPEVLYSIKSVPGGLSRDYVPVLDQHERVFGDAYQQLSESGGMTDSRARAFACAMSKDAYFYIERGHADKARHYFAVAKQMHREGWLDRFNSLVRPIARCVSPVLASRLTQFRRRLSRA